MEHCWRQPPCTIAFRRWSAIISVLLLFLTWRALLPTLFYNHITVLLVLTSTPRPCILAALHADQSKGILDKTAALQHQNVAPIEGQQEDGGDDPRCHAQNYVHWACQVRNSPILIAQHTNLSATNPTPYEDNWKNSTHDMKMLIREYMVCSCCLDHMQA